MNGTVDQSSGRGPRGVRGSACRCVLAVVAGLATGAWAQPAPLTIKDQAVKSDLVFRGVVEKIEYAQAEPSGQEQSQVPHTFITYHVEEVLRGDAKGETVTLRFIGGPSPKTGRILSSSISPRIDMGDEDLLFVEGNTERLVPLVGNQDGRFRIIDGQVYSEMGESVLLDGNGGINLGAQYRIDAVQTTTVNGKVSTIRYEPGTPELPSDAAPVADFVALVKQLVKDAPAAGEFVSADPAQPFKGPDLNPAPPPAPKPGEATPAPQEPAPETVPHRR